MPKKFLPPGDYWLLKVSTLKVKNRLYFFLKKLNKINEGMT